MTKLDDKFATEKRVHTKAAQEYRRALEEDLDDLKTEAIGYAKQAATAAGVVGGVLFVGRKLLKGRRKRKRTQQEAARQEAALRAAVRDTDVVKVKEKRTESAFWTFVKGVLATALAAIAREKIGTFIDRLTAEPADDSQPRLPAAGDTTATKP